MANVQASRTGYKVAQIAALFVTGLLITGLSAGDALAQRVPYRERPDSYQRQGEHAHKPGVFDYYVLALSWSPTYCADVGSSRREPQCHPRGERRYAFVLHGLWPQYERGWPENCRSADRGYVPRPVANRMLDIMPSDRLIFNEYRKHGTCSGLGVDGYFDLARQLYDKITIPKRFVGLTDERMMISPDGLVREFLDVNPGLKPDMIAVQCGGPGNRLKEVRVCFDKGGQFRACGSNESPRRLCTANHMYVPPVRSGAEGARPQQTPPGSQREIVPGPRDERRL
jgi:ribonuclease T2